MDSIIDETFVINMEHNSDRLEVFDSMMNKLNWPYQRFAAVNGKKLEELQIDTINSNGNNVSFSGPEFKRKYVSPITFLNHGEIGCMLSHVLLFEKVAYNPNLHRIAIFEDDARTYIEGDTIHNLLNDFYNHIEANSIPEPDILYLGKALDYCCEYTHVHGNVYNSIHPLCFHAYIITKNGARKMLEMAPITMPIDFVPIQAIKKGKFRAMVFHPSLFNQDVFNTSSDLRQYAINNNVECISPYQHVTEDGWYCVIAIFIGFIAILVLYFLLT